MSANVGAITALILAFILAVIGYALGPTLLSFVATSGGSAEMGSFAGTRNINDLGALFYYMGLAVAVIATMVLGALGIAGRGPLRGRS